MARTINMTQLRVTRMELDYVQNRVAAWYDLLDAQGKVWESGVAFFWVTLPPVPPGGTQPKENIQLPASYIPTLVGLKNDAQTALENLFLV